LEIEGPTLTTRILTIGAGGHGLVAVDILRAARAAHGSPEFDVVGVLDDNPARTGASLLDVPVLGPTWLLPDIPHDAVFVAIGDNVRREQITLELIRRGEQLFTARHPGAIVAAGVDIGPGCMIAAGAVLSPGVVLGMGAIINTRCSVDHCTVVEPFAHVSAGATVGGDITIGARALVGIGSTVMSQLRIGADALVGAGAVVIRDIPDGVVAAGVPAKVLRSIASAKS
jgi:sugar O-acyltransferase (sialic acid O-acetyltransferase NeuD family)